MQLQTLVFALSIAISMAEGYSAEAPDGEVTIHNTQPLKRNDPAAEAPPYKIVFVCDASASTQDTFATLKDELSRTIDGLKPVQSFDIIFYGGEKVRLFKPELVAATPETKRMAETWLENVETAGKSDPIAALETALKLKPDLIDVIAGPDVLPDAGGVSRLIDKLNKDRQTQINTILFVTENPEKGKRVALTAALKDIASRNGGRFSWVNIDETAPPLIPHIGPQTQPASPDSAPAPQWIRCYGNTRKIVFVCDGSREIQDKSATLKEELHHAVLCLRPIHPFDVIFYRDGKAEAFKAALVNASPEAKRDLAVWLDGVKSEGASDATAAMEMALKLKPDIIYFASGSADPSSVKRIKGVIDAANKDRTIWINTLLLARNAGERGKNDALEQVLKDIAADNHGWFKRVAAGAIESSAISTIFSRPAAATQPTLPGK